MPITINFHPPLPSLPKRKNKREIDLRYLLVSPFVMAHIYWDSKLNELIYEIEEPKLSDHELKILEELETAMLELINVNVAVEKTIEATTKYIDKTARLLIDELNLEVDNESYEKIFYYLFRDFIGFNEIDSLLRDYFIEDIECNGVNTPVYIVHRVYRNLRTNIIYKDIDKLGSFVEKLAQRSGKYISYAQPMLDGSLPDGSRVNATYTKDITSRGPTFSIRKFTESPWTPPKLIDFGTLSPEMLAYFWILIENKANIMIAGGTSSGKTTLLNAIAFFIPPEERVVSLEDTREINIPKENWLPAVARTSIGMGKIGEVDLFSLLRSSFRQNPDYVIVGEVRGKEAFVLFQGMASGHASISTMHADSIETLIRRLETPPIELSPTLVNSLDCIAITSHAIVNKQETRRVREIVEVIRINSDGGATINKPFIWNPRDDKFYFNRTSQVFQKISLRTGTSLGMLQREFQIRARLIYELYRRRIINFNDVGNIINEYYKNPEAVLRRFGMLK